jgi:hypothetical protein
MFKKVIVCFFCFILLAGTEFFGSLLAQEETALEAQIESILESNPDADVEMLEEVVHYYLKNPISINRANLEDWMQLPFLSPIHINKILHYRQTYGDFLHIYELQAVGLPKDILQELRIYCTLDEKILVPLTWKNLKTGKQSIELRYTRKLEKQEGYRTIDKNGNEKALKSRYIGSPDAFALRYRYRLNNRLSFGFTVSQTEGENLFNNPYYKYGFDFYAGHLMFQNVSIVKTLIIGDYQALFGQGLNFYSAFGMGKSTQVLMTEKNKEGIYPHTSLNEYQFLRGLALELKLPKYFSLFLFASYKFKDAGITEDTVSQVDLLGSISNSNNHNTVNSLEKRHQLQEWLLGSHLSFKYKQLKLGITGNYLNLGLPILPAEALYKKYDFSGKHHFNVGFDFRWTIKNFYVFGEYGMSQNAGFAAILGVLAVLHPKLTATLVLRNYEKDYHTFYAQSFGEGTNPRNQRGIYTGFVIDFNEKWQAQTFLDVFQNPWLTSYFPAQSTSFDYLLQLNYSYKKKQLMYWKYRYKQKETTFTEDRIAFFSAEPAHEFRWNVSYALTTFWQAQSRVEVKYRPNLKEEPWGYAFLQDIKFKPKSFPLSATLRYVLFYTTYDTRVYAYETDIPSAYPIVSYFDKGHRFYLFLHYKILRGLDCWARYDISYYPDRETIGSGYSEIRGSTKSEFKIALKYSF